MYLNVPTHFINNYVHYNVKINDPNKFGNRSPHESNDIITLEEHSNIAIKLCTTYYITGNVPTYTY